MSDILRRRIAAALLIAGIAVAVLAIEDVGPFSDPITAQQRAEDAVEGFFAAAAAGDSKTFCALLTADARERLRVSTAQRLRTDELPECTKILDVLAPAFADSVFSVRFVSVSGNRARVEGRYKLAGAGSQPRTVLLTLDDGEWRVSDPG
jgi:ketosteroid isomerase-like protein